MILIAAANCKLTAAMIDTSLVNQKIDSIILISDNKYELNNIDECIDERLKAVGLLKSIGNWKKLVYEYNILNVVYNLSDNLHGASESLDSAYKYSVEYLLETDVEYTFTMGNLGYSEYMLTNYTKCIQYTEKALASFEKNGVHLNESFNTLELLLNVYRNKGDIQKSSELANKYLTKVDPNKDIEIRAKLLFNIGMNFFQDSKFSEALLSLNKAYKTVSKLQGKKTRLDLEIDLKIAIANTYFEIGDTLKSSETFNSIEISQTDNSELIEEFYYHLGSNYFNTKDYDAAIKNFSTAYLNRSSRELSIEKALSNYTSFLGISYYENGQQDSAEFYINKALTYLGVDLSNDLNEYDDFNDLANFNINNVRTHSRAAKVFRKKFSIDFNTKYIKAALRNYRQAFNGAKFLQKELSSKHSKYLLNKQLQEHYPAYLELLLEIYAEDKSPETFTEILQLIEDNKAVVLKEDIQDKLARTSSSIPQELLDKDIEFKEELNTLKRKIHEFKPKDEEGEAVVNQWKEEELQTTRAYADHQKYLEDNYPAYYEAKYAINSLDLSALKNQLEKNQSFLSFYETDEHWYCAWVKKDREGVHTIEKTEGNKAALSSVLNIIRKNPLDAFNAQDLPNFKAASQLLYKELIPEELHSSTSFVISQIGELYYLPFEVLLTGEDADAFGFSELSYLLREKDIQYASSAELWLDSKNQRSNFNSLSAISFAPFTEGEKTEERNCVADAKMSALGCTKKELEHISANLSAQAFYSERASLANFEKMDSASIIHLATHACLDDEDDAFNKLIFYDDYLSIQDLENMQLNADLAVLSACNTGSGKMKAGEGVIHLGKAFRSAGVSSLVTSLWSINDCATADIVGNFYSQLDKSNISSALRTAKLDYLENSNKLMAHPHFWAGLTFSGNADAITTSQSFSEFFPYLAACLLLILGFFFFRHRK